MAGHPLLGCWFGSSLHWPPLLKVVRIGPSGWPPFTWLLVRFFLSLATLAKGCSDRSLWLATLYLVVGSVLGWVLILFDLRLVVDLILVDCHLRLIVGLVLFDCLDIGLVPVVGQLRLALSLVLSDVHLRLAVGCRSVLVDCHLRFVVGHVLVSSLEIGLIVIC